MERLDISDMGDAKTNQTGSDPFSLIMPGLLRDDKNVGTITTIKGT